MANSKGKDMPQSKIFRLSEDEFYVESSPERKFCYRVLCNEEEKSCTCGDFTSTVKKDPKFRCEHILAVENAKGSDFEEERPRLDERFIQNIQGRDFVVYGGILDLAHQKGLKSVLVEALQYPTEENGLEAICKATIESEAGEIFTELGDANPKNVNPKIARHVLRMAATRAKARALRDFTNIGMTCLEEIDADDVVPETRPKSAPLKFEPRSKEPAKPPKRESKKPAEDNSKPPQKEITNEEPASENSKEQFSAKLSSAQLKAIENLAKRRGMTSAELSEHALETFGRKSLDALTQAEASAIIRSLQQSA